MLHLKKPPLKLFLILLSLWGYTSRLTAQDYLNDFSLRYGMAIPLGNYAGHNRDVNDVVGGMQIGMFSGVEFKTRMLNIRTTKFGNFTSVDYLDNAGFFLVYDRFETGLSKESLKNIVLHDSKLNQIGKWKVNNLMMGFTLREFLSENLVIMLKGGGGLTEVTNPYITIFRDGEITYRRPSSRFSSFGATVGVDLMLHLDRILIQLQSECQWSRPYVNTTTLDNVVGELIPYKESSYLVLPKLNLTLGYSFLE